MQTQVVTKVGLWVTTVYTLQPIASFSDHAYKTHSRAVWQTNTNLPFPPRIELLKVFHVDGGAVPLGYLSSIERLKEKWMWEKVTVIILMRR